MGENGFISDRRARGDEKVRDGDRDMNNGGARSDERPRGDYGTVSN